MATRTASDLSAFVGDSKDNAIMVDLDNMDASDVDKLVEEVKKTTSNEKTTVNGNGKRKTISSSSSTPSSYASNKKRRTGKKKKKKVTSSHSSSKMQEDALAVVAVPAPPTMVPFGFVDVAYLVFTVIWAACDLGSLMVEESPDYETLRVQAFDELRSENSSNMDFGVYNTFKSNLIALVKEHKDWKTSMDVKSYRSEREMKDGETMEGINYQSSLLTLIGYMNWRVKVLADSKSVPALLDNSKSIEECVKGLSFDYNSVGSAKNYLIETLYVVTTGNDVPSHFAMDQLGHGLDTGKEHALKKEKMWKALCDTESSFLRKMVSALRDEQGDMRTAADRFWKGLTTEQQQDLEAAATCVSAPDEATCKNFVMPDEKRSKKAVPAACFPFTLEMNENEFELVVPEGSDDDGKKNSQHYVYLEGPVEQEAREQIEQEMFGEESDEVMKALYAVLCLVKRDKKGKGNPLRWKESFIDAMNAFVVTLNPAEEDEGDDDDASSSDSDGGSEIDSDSEDDSDDGDQDNKGNRP